MAKDWIKFKLGRDWGKGDDDLFVRISMIQAITPTEREGESLVYVMVDNAFDVEGTPEEIMEMINARS